jgi:Transposase DDE domain group 1
LKVQRDGRNFTVDVAADGEGLVSHAGAALLGEVADRVGLTGELCRALAGVREQRGRHDSGRVIRDLAVMLADGGDCLSDLRGVRDQEPLFGPVASDSTAFRLIDRIADEPALLDALRVARAAARERAWGLGVHPKEIVIDIDATLVNAHTADARTATGSQVAICCTSCRRGAGKPSATSTHLSDGQSRTQRVLDV